MTDRALGWGEGGGWGLVSQPESKSRAELRALPGVPDISGGGQCCPRRSSTWAGRLGSPARIPRGKTELERVRDAEWTWNLGHPRA